MVAIYQYYIEFCYNVYNQPESFISLNSMVKNKDIRIERYLSDGHVPNLCESDNKIIISLIT
jgi:hypothetical protein